MEKQQHFQELKIGEEMKDQIEMNVEQQLNQENSISNFSKSKKKYQKIIEKLKKIKKKELKKRNINAQINEQKIEGDDYSEVIRNQEKLKILKEIMSSVPAYLLMSQAQKRKFFKTVNNQFYESLQKELGSQCSHQKSVHFNLERNKIKTFNKSDNVLEISQSII
ncbi:unnamed protein product [Paramecium sonneborni]|uniref:Uncharacterized protein n=1 Tax=Paramecium sonneborni TaxID=65129 RepID=A0A8S1NF89_9CILI|nr:unnamed protein product [Paramecium sonneborni]